MLKITMLGIALAAIALAGMMTYVADSKTIPLSLTHGLNGIQASDVECTDSRVQMTSPSGMSVCVFEQSMLELESRGFEFVNEPFDMFPIKMPTGSNGGVFTSPGFSSPPVISMSNLPEIGETAMVNITYTNDIGVNITTTENQPTEAIFKVGWLVSSGFEVVDNGGNEPWAINGSSREPARLGYNAFVPLDAGESFTYIIEVRAVEEKLSYIGARGYGLSNSLLHVWLDDLETLTDQEHKARYPKLHQPLPDPPVAKTPGLRDYTDKELAAIPDYVPPSRELLADFFAAYFADEDTDDATVGEAMDFVQQVGYHLNYTLPDLKEILGAADYTDKEIEAEWSSRASTQSFSQLKIT